MKKHFSAVVAVVVLLVTGCAQRVDIQAEQTAAKKVVDEFQKAMETNDIKLMSRIMAHDTEMVNFGTDAAERWVGYDAFKKAVEEQFAAFENTKLSVKDQRIKVHRSGGAAWFSEVADWKMVVQGKPVSIQGTRITGVLEKRNGNWVIVQFHVSAPVAGQAAPY